MATAFNLYGCIIPDMHKLTQAQVATLTAKHDARRFNKRVTPAYLAVHEASPNACWAVRELFERKTPADYAALVALFRVIYPEASADFQSAARMGIANAMAKVGGESADLIRWNALNNFGKVKHLLLEECPN